MNGPPSARDMISVHGFRSRGPSATFVGQSSEAKYAASQQRDMSADIPGRNMTPRRLVSATNTPRSYSDHATLGGVTPRMTSSNPIAQFPPSVAKENRQNIPGALRINSSGGTVPGQSDPMDVHVWGEVPMSPRSSGSGLNMVRNLQT